MNLHTRHAQDHAGRTNAPASDHAQDESRARWHEAHNAWPEFVLVAARYERGVHQPDHPAWWPFVEITRKLWKRLVGPLDVRVRHVSDPEPYPDHESLCRDLRCGALAVYGGQQTFAPARNGKEHRLASRYIDGRTEGHTEMERWRAVLAAYGHGGVDGLNAAPFDAVAGHLQAYVNLRALYPAEALPALSAEVLGKTAYYYANGHHMPINKAVVFDPPEGMVL